jgi:hypothetical protein
LTCIRVVVGHERPLGEGCSAPQTDPGAVPTTAREHCNPSGLLLTGVAGPNVRGIDAVLGDGTLRRVPLDRLPASFGDPRRAYALGPESGTAVRSLRIHLLQRVQTLPLEQAPGGATCRPGLSNQAEFLVGGFATEPQAAPVGPLVARDDGDRLCVGLGTIVPEDCQIPPIDALLPRIDVRRAGGQTALLAVVAPEVASLRLELDRGAPVTVSPQRTSPATPGAMPASCMVWRCRCPPARTSTRPTSWRQTDTSSSTAPGPTCARWPTRRRCSRGSRAVWSWPRAAAPASRSA